MDRVPRVERSPMSRSEKTKRLRGAGCFALALVFGGLGVLPGCSSTPRPIPEPEPIVLPDVAPEDFALSITVISPASADDPIDDLPRAERPARYVVEPDGVLRAAIGPGATPRVYPRQTRQLDAARVQRLWRLVGETGLLEPGTLTRIDNTEIFFPQRSRPTALVYIRQQGAGSHFAVRLPVGDAESAGVGQLIDELAELAWVPE